MEKLQHNNETIQQESTMKLGELKKEILLGEKELPIKEIEEIINSGLEDQQIVDKLYDILSTRKDFNKVVNRYRNKILHGESSHNVGEVFFYLYDLGYILLFGDSISKPTIKKYTKRQVDYSKYQVLSNLFDTELPQKGFYCEIDDPDRYGAANTVYDVIVINKQKVTDANLDWVIANELTHVLIFNQLYLTQDLLLTTMPRQTKEALSDIISSNIDFNSYLSNLIFALINTFFPNGGISEGMLHAYEASYRVQLNEFIQILESTNDLEAFNVDFRKSWEKYRNDHQGQSINYYNFMMPFILNNYKDLLYRHKDKINANLLSIGKKVIKEFKQTVANNH